MNIAEAVKTGQRLKRKGATDWFEIKLTGNVFTSDDLKADDWVTMECKTTVDLSVKLLEDIYTKINDAPPGMSRGAFRELVFELLGFQIK